MANTASHDPYEIQSGSSQPATQADPSGPGQHPADPHPADHAHLSGSASGPVAESGGSNPISVLLWTLAAILAGTNTALSIAGLEIIGSVAGAGALACLIILFVRYRRRRR